MSNSEENELTEALLDLKEAYLISVSKRLISNRIPESEILLLARTLPPQQVIRKLKRSYFFYYLWGKMMQWRRKNKGRDTIA